MKRSAAYILIALLCTLTSCRDKIEPTPTPGPDPDPVLPNDTIPEKPLWPEGKGKSYVWDDDVVPEVTIIISEQEWNNLLTEYDKNSNTTKYVKAAAVFNKADVCDTLSEIGIRLRDNLRCRRPEGKAGEKHKVNEAEWHQSNFELSFSLYDSDASLREVSGIFLKSCVNDPSYARERYCFDLFERYGIPFMPRNIYCKVNIHVEGDEKAAYFGLYQMIEPIDSDYLKDRIKIFGNDKGFLWKCRTGATLATSNQSMDVMSSDGKDPTYALVNNHKAFSMAKEQLSSFIDNLNKLNNNNFYEWIETVIDVKTLLKSYAVLVAVGAADDYWNTGNNYYLYFNLPSADKYKLFFIPHNFEVSLGNNDGSIMADSALQNPMEWGRTKNPLMGRLLQNAKYADMFKAYLQELTSPESYLFCKEAGMLTVMDFMYDAAPYTSNATGTNMRATDRTAAWSSKEYRLTEDSDINFFKVRSETIQSVLAKE